MIAVAGRRPAAWNTFVEGSWVGTRLGRHAGGRRPTVHDSKCEHHPSSQRQLHHIHGNSLHTALTISGSGYSIHSSAPAPDRYRAVGKSPLQRPNTRGRVPDGIPYCQYKFYSVCCAGASEPNKRRKSFGARVSPPCCARTQRRGSASSAAAPGVTSGALAPHAGMAPVSHRNCLRKTTCRCVNTV